MPEGTRFPAGDPSIPRSRTKNTGANWELIFLLGAPTDAMMTTSQQQFLPDNLMKSFDSVNQNHQLVLSDTNLFPVNPENNKGSVFTPLFVFSLLFLVIVLPGLSRKELAKNFLQGFDGFFFFLTGVLGILLVFMWVATDHSMTKDNYNLLWAWPTNALTAFFVNSKRSWVKKYFGFHALALILVLLSWFFLPQQMNNALIPLVLLLIFISIRKYLNPPA